MIHHGNLIITKDNQHQYTDLREVGGYLSIESNCEFKAPLLRSVGGDLYINSELDDEFVRRLWKHNRTKKWILSDQTNDWLLNRKGKINYKIEGIKFDRDLFFQVRNDKLTAEQVFQIKNIEQRRVAYERMDKTKIQTLPNLKILDETIDQQGKPMQLIEFMIKGYNKPFRFLHCIDASTNREYYLERTNDTNCWAAKNQSFGLKQNHRYTKEW